MDPSTALWIPNFMKISLFLGSRVRRQDEPDGSFYRTLDTKFPENIMIFDDFIDPEYVFWGNMQSTIEGCTQKMIGKCKKRQVFESTVRILTLKNAIGHRFSKSSFVYGTTILWNTVHRYPRGL